MKRAKWYLVLLLVGILLFVGGCTEEPPVIPPVPVTPTEYSDISIPIGEFQIVITGSGDKTSPPFTVTTKEWTIDWSYVPNPEYPELAIFGFYVYPRGETVMFVEAVLSSDTTSGSTYSYSGASEYYIKVIAANVKSWEIVISPPYVGKGLSSRYKATPT